jgi:hypothetical protein
MALLTLTMSTACSLEEAPAGVISSIPGRPVAEDVVRSDAVVAGYHGADTVWLWPAMDAHTLVWTSHGIERWRSAFAYESVAVTVTLIDSDSTPDLFYTVNDRDALGGILLLASGGTVRQAFMSAEDACRPPDLQRASEDRSWDVVHYAPGAISRDQCRTFDFTRCAERYPTEWFAPYLQRENGTFELDTIDTFFYRQMALLYAQARHRLMTELALREEEGQGAASIACGQEMIDALDSLRWEARRFGYPGYPIPTPAGR